MNIRKPYEVLRFVLLGFVVVLGMTSIIASMNPSQVKDLSSQPNIYQLDADIQSLKNSIVEQQKMLAIQHELYNESLHEKDDAGVRDFKNEISGTESKLHALSNALSDAKAKREELVAQSKGCFPSGTLVKMEDGSLKPFAQIKPGDMVLTYDIGYDTLKNRKVLGVYSVEANHLYAINGELMTTGGERLLSQDGWKEVRDLQKGDTVHINGAMKKIYSIEYSRVNTTLHNMQVEGTHNFYVVTANGSKYLVHNSDSGGGGGGGK